MNNRDVRKSLEGKKGNDILIWSWNNPVPHFQNFHKKLQYTTDRYYSPVPLLPDHSQIVKHITLIHVDVTCRHCIHRVDVLKPNFSNGSNAIAALLTFYDYKPL